MTRSAPDQAGAPRSRDPADLWRRVQDCWDRRLDPLDDPTLQAELLHQPDLLAEVLRVADAVDQLERAPAVAVKRALPHTGRRPLAVSAQHRLWIPAAALLLTAGLGVCLWLETPGKPVPPRTGFAVQSYTLRTSIEAANWHRAQTLSPTGRQLEHFAADGLTSFQLTQTTELR